MSHAFARASSPPPNDSDSDSDYESSQAITRWLHDSMLDQTARLNEREQELQTREAEFEKAREHQLAVLEAQQRRIQELEAVLASQQAPNVREGDEEATQDALEPLEAAEAAIRDDTLQEARSLLLRPDARSAAKALMIMSEAFKNCEQEEAVSLISAANRAVRDVIVRRLLTWALPGNRESFVQAAKDAFGGPLDTHLNAVMLLAYSKYMDGSPDAFISNNGRQNARRGRPRPARQRNALQPPATVGGGGGGEAEAEAQAEEEGPRRRDIGQEMWDGNPEASAQWLAAPAWVPLQFYEEVWWAPTY